MLKYFWKKNIFGKKTKKTDQPVNVRPVQLSDNADLKENVDS